MHILINPLSGFVPPYAIPPLPRNSEQFRRAFEESPLAGRDMEETTSKPRALVVDDAPDVMEMIGMLMRFAGYEVVMALNATEAFDAARSAHFDVVISDIGMPGMNGYQLAEALRALPDYADVPIIAVTGFSMYDDRERALGAGFNDFLTKPINPMNLIDTVKRLRE